MFAGMLNTNCEVYGVDNFSFDYEEDNNLLNNQAEKFSTREYFYKNLDQFLLYQSIYDFDLKTPIAIVIGGENKGIRPQVRKECDFVGSIPIKENIESLNVSVATGIVLYEAIRQRKYK